MVLLLVLLFDLLLAFLRRYLTELPRLKCFLIFPQTIIKVIVEEALDQVSGTIEFSCGGILFTEKLFFFGLDLRALLLNVLGGHLDVNLLKLPLLSLRGNILATVAAPGSIELSLKVIVRKLIIFLLFFFNGSLLLHNLLVDIHLARL